MAACSICAIISRASWRRASCPGSGAASRRQRAAGPARGGDRAGRHPAAADGADARPPGLFYASPGRVFALGYHAEQVPDPESRVTLGEGRDAHGVPLPRVDLRYGNADIASVLKAHRVLDRLLRAAGQGRVEWVRGAAERAEHVRAQAMDGYHQIGLTRMAASPREGVVDGDLAVHGVRNLWIAGTGVLPTGSQAHPTFSAVARALRLAEHLAAGRARSRPARRWRKRRWRRRAPDGSWGRDVRGGRAAARGCAGGGTAAHQRHRRRCEGDAMRVSARGSEVEFLHRDGRDGGGAGRGGARPVDHAYGGGPARHAGAGGGAGGAGRGDGERGARLYRGAGAAGAPGADRRGSTGTGTG